MSNSGLARLTIIFAGMEFINVIYGGDVEIDLTITIVVQI